MHLHKKNIIIIILIIIILNINSISYAITIVLDPGHGGKDTGAIGYNNLYERDIVLKIANYIKEYLANYKNTNVILTHNGLASNVELEVYDRAIIARNNKADLFISLHINAATQEDAKGAEIFVTANKSLSKYNEETTNLSNKILTNLVSLGLTNRGVKTKFVSDITDVYSDGTLADYYGIIRYGMRGSKINNGKLTQGTSANIQNGEGTPSILIEHGFIKGDNSYLDTDEKIKKLAKADADGIIQHYNLQLNTNNKYKIDGNYVITEPDTVLTDIKETSSKDIQIKTGQKIIISDKEYTVIKMGDGNGDGKVDAIDLLLVKRHLLGTNILKNEYLKAIKINKDVEEVDAVDLLLVKRHLLGTNLITI